MRKRLILYAGIALLVGYYVWDRDNSTVEVVAGTVTQVEDRDLDAGPDSWHVTVDLAGQTVELAPLQARPDLAPGDKVCVARVARGDAVTYRRANADDVC